MSGDSQVSLSIRCSHTASRMPPGHPHAYVIRGDGHFTTTPGHSGLEPGELEERTKRRNNEFNLCRERLMQRKHSHECWSQTVLGSYPLPWKSPCVCLGGPTCKMGSYEDPCLAAGQYSQCAAEGAVIKP